MKVTDCKIIEDIIPLCKEGICSDESKAIVEEHIKECEMCRKLYEEIPQENTESILNVPKESKVFLKVNRKMKRSKLKIILLSLVTVMILGVFGVLTYGQITHECRSFDTIIQTIEIKQLVNKLIDGDISGYIDSLSFSGFYSVPRDIAWHNMDMRKDARQEMQKAYDKYLKNADIKKVWVGSTYGASLSTKEGEMSNVSNTVIIYFTNGSELHLNYVKNYDGLYMCSYASYCENGEYKENEFAHLLENMSSDDFIQLGMAEVLFKKITADYPALENGSQLFHSTLFAPEVQEKVDDAMRNFYKNGYTFSNVVFSELYYDTERKMRYYNVYFESDCDGGHVLMKTKLYYSLYGLLPPEPDDISVLTEGDCQELADAVRGFFG